MQLTPIVTTGEPPEGAIPVQGEVRAFAAGNRVVLVIPGHPPIDVHVFERPIE